MALKQEFWTEGDLALLGTLRCLGTRLVTSTLASSAGREARVTVEYPAVHRTALTTKRYPVQNVSSAI